MGLLVSLTCYGIHSVQDYPSGRKREGGRDSGREGGIEEREVQVGLGKFYQQDWSPPAGGLCPAWLRS